MSEAPRRQDAIEAQALCDLCGRLVGKNTLLNTAGTAYIQSTVSQAGIDALVAVLIHKGILTEAELVQSLAIQYRRQADRLGAQGQIVIPAPTVNGAVRPQ